MELVLARSVLGSAHGGSAHQCRPAVSVRVPRLHAVSNLRDLIDRRVLRGGNGSFLLVGATKTGRRSMVCVPGRRQGAAGEMGTGTLWNHRVPVAGDGGSVHQNDAAPCI